MTCQSDPMLLSAPQCSLQKPRAASALLAVLDASAVVSHDMLMSSCICPGNTAVTMMTSIF